MLALLYDIHGNLPALDAVLDEAQEEGADGYLLGGDFAAYSPWALETVERLRALPPRPGSGATASAGCASRRPTGPR